MLPDFAFFPPEINSGLIYTGPGSGPMLAAATAWDDLASELYTSASGYSSVIADLTSGWLGPSSVSMAAAATPYVSWISTTAGQAAATGAQAKAAAAAFDAAFAMTVPPPVIAANRALLFALIATNFFGQNTPAIMATEAQYMEMWAQDATAMYGYQNAAQMASTFVPFLEPVHITNEGAVAGQAASVGQALNIGAGNAGQVVSQFTSMATPMTSGLSTTPLSSAVSNTGVASTLSSTTLSSTTTSQVSALTTSSTALTSGTGLVTSAGSSATMPASGLSSLGSASALMRSVTPVTQMFGNQVFGSVITGGTGPTSGIFTSTMGSTAVNAGVGRAATLGVLSVPQNWATAAPAFSQVASAAPASSAGAAAAAPGMAAASPGTMMPPPLASLAGRSSAAPMGSTPRFDVRPAVVQRPVEAG